MKKDSYESLDDGFINFYKEWIFYRCYEYSAMHMAEVTWYKIFLNINKKTWKVYLECWIPKDKFTQFQTLLDDQGHSYRISQNSGLIENCIWQKKITKDVEELKKVKISLIKF